MPFYLDRYGEVKDFALMKLVDFWSSLYATLLLIFPMNNKPVQRNL